MKKMNQLIIFVFILLIGTACTNSGSPKLTEEDAISVVTERHSREDKEVKINAVNHGSGKYKVEWEIDADCEFGTDYIDDQSGEIVRGEETNC
ncbi:hypothetical protein [Oceanobacillus kapialis]|uniref:PepSY domain-containing protein n=1 Tax=Oceanobacillus kapialis TaxID=481353 RepID=A0ABW5PXM9_9BACI